MAKITLITGAQCTGKTLLSLKLSGKKRTKIINDIKDIDNKETFINIPKFLIIDGVVFNKRIVKYLKKIIEVKTYYLKKPFKLKSSRYNYPHVIIVSTDHDCDMYFSKNELFQHIHINHLNLENGTQGA